MNPTQARDCAGFLKELRRTGNVSLASERAGVHRYTLQRWRGRFPDFASEWDAAIAFAEARLLGEGAQPPASDAEVTRGGEYSVRATRGRRMQVRRAPPGLLTPAGERTFLAHLAATANVRLSAAATGIGWNAIYARRRRSPQFAREMELALAEGYDRLELALLANSIASLEQDGTDLAEWRQQADALPEPLERMRVQDALMLLSFRRPNMVNSAPHAGLRARRPTEAETDAALRKALDRIEKRIARDKARGEEGS